MDANTLGSHVANTLVFRGAKEKPFLAPRGVHVKKNWLCVADTGQNRVLIWKKIPSTTFQEPHIILGQKEIVDFGRNAKGNPDASSFHYPSGVWTDGNKLIVADAWNHRVLIWNNMPTSHRQSADVVLGQPHFETNLPNVDGVGKHPTAQTLNWPYGLHSDGKHLWVADTGNRRVLFYDTIPNKNYAKADAVIGKPNFNTKDYNDSDPIWPYAVKVHHQGAIAIADTQFNRVLMWHQWKDALSHKKADIIIGQKNFTDSGQNQSLINPGPNTLNWVYDMCFYKNGVLVNDTGNSRILGYDVIPGQSNANADWLIGRPDFNTSSDYKGNLKGTQCALYWPFSTYVEQNTLYIADTGNHRLIVAELTI